jgi:hypothetical protein
MKTITKEYIKQQLSSNPSWAIRALVKIYERQTLDEQCSGQTKEHNNVGFSGVDSVILSSFATQVLAGRVLSQKQMTLLYKKIPRYHRQIISMIPADKLQQIEEKLTVNS